MKKSILALLIAAASTSAFATVEKYDDETYIRGSQHYKVYEDEHKYGGGLVIQSSESQSNGDHVNTYTRFDDSGLIQGKIIRNSDEDGVSSTSWYVDLVTEKELTEKLRDVEQTTIIEGDFNTGSGSVCHQGPYSKCNVTVNGTAEVKFNDLTDAQKLALKGADGAKGDKGDAGADGKDGKDADMTIVNSNTDRITELEGKEDKMRTDAEIKAIADVGDKILGNEIDKLRDETVAKNNAQDKAIKTQWDLIQDVEEKNEQQDISLAGKVDREEFMADQASQNQAISDVSSRTTLTEMALNHLATETKKRDEELATEIADTKRIADASLVETVKNSIAIDVTNDRITSEVERIDYNVSYAQQTADAALSTAAQNQQWIVQLGDESRAEDARLDAKIDGVHQLSVERDEQLQKHIDVVDASSQKRDEALLAGLNSVNDASVERDKQLAADIVAGDKSTLDSANKYTDASVATAQKANQAAREEMAEEQAKVDNLQNKQIATQAKTILQNQDRLTATETSVADLYALGNERDQRIAKNSEAIKALDGRVSNLEQKVEEQGSFIAGIGAQAAIPQADLYVGETALGMGAYTDAHNNDALALQLQTMPSEKVRVNVGLSAAPEDFSNTWQASVGGVVKF